MVSVKCQEQAVLNFTIRSYQYYLVLVYEIGLVNKCGVIEKRFVSSS